MSQALNSSTAVVEGEIIRPPVWRSLSFLGLGAVLGALGLGMLKQFGYWVLFILNLGAPTPTPTNLREFIIGCLLLFAAGSGFRMAFWHIRNRPHWVIGKDRLQFVEKGSLVRLTIPYSNLAAAELCRPAMGTTPFTGFRDALTVPKKSFIGLRLVYPDLIKSYAGGSPLDAHRMHERFGYHWRIMDAECAVSLKIVLSMILNSWEHWRATASHLPDSPSASTSDTTITSSPPAQQNFTQENP